MKKKMFVPLLIQKKISLKKEKGGTIYTSIPTSLISYILDFVMSEGGEEVQKNGRFAYVMGSGFLMRHILLRMSCEHMWIFVSHLKLS
jgi:hypothetical protein